jgi:ATP-dependent Clp protease ATP-binding subunit ClpB
LQNLSALRRDIFGHRETKPALTQQALDQYHTDTVKISIVLFDEIEKASDALWNLLLGILDKATVTLRDNCKVDFSKAMIFMTSNVGAREMSS